MHKFLFLTLFTFLFSQAEITNIQASQRTDGSQIVDITYDLLEDDLFEDFTVYIEISYILDDNYTVDFYYPENVSGDVGAGINPGLDKSIIWDVGLSLPATYLDNIIIKITASSEINFNDESPFNTVNIFHNNHDDIEIDYDFEIMEKRVTHSEYASWLMEKLNNDELIIDCGNQFIDDGINSYYQQCDIYAFFEGNDNYDPGNALIHRIDINIGGDTPHLKYNGTIFFVDEGNGGDYIYNITESEL